MTTLATIRQAMTAFLAEAGIEALSAWPKEVWKGRKTQALLEQVAQALMERGPAGFAVEKWSAGETAFDQASGMFWGKLQAVCRGMLVAGMEESGELEGFTVRGEVTL